LVLGVQLVIAGIQLPSKYLVKEWPSLSLLVGPGMVCMWLATSIIVHMVAAPPSFLYSLAVGACVTPTDPVLSNVIVKGKFADQNFSRELQNLIIAESGANDGLGYPFLFFALYLIRFTAGGTSVTAAGLGEAFGVWIALTWGYVILLSVLYGAVVGWLGKVLLYWCEQRNFVDRESFLVFAISLALFVLGTCGLIGTDEVLACFVAGNALTWDDWFRVETEDDSLQPTIDMLLNVSVFLWYGAAMPWFRFGDEGVIHTWRLIVLAAAVLLFRRLPWIFTMHVCGWIPEITETKQAVFMGFFGPIGVSAVYYIFVTVDFIEKHLAQEEGVLAREAKEFGELVRTVVWFLCTCSIVSSAALHAQPSSV
jgi:sodium/hydrogen antiporter